MEGLKRAAAGLRDKLTKSPLERLLTEATTNDNWGAPTTLLHQISEKTYSSSQDQDTVLRFFWENLRSPAKDWRRLYKVLHLAEHLLRFGSTGCVRDIKDGAYKIRELLDFSYNEDGTERGSGVRDKARSVLGLIQNSSQLEEEREAARKQMGRYVGISSDEYKRGVRPGTGGKSYEGRSNFDSNIVRGYDDDPRFRESTSKETKPEPPSDLFKQTAAALDKPPALKPVLATTPDTTSKGPAKPIAAPPNFITPPKPQPEQSFFPPTQNPAPTTTNIFAPVTVTPVPPKPAAPATENIFQAPILQPVKPTQQPPVKPAVQQPTPFLGLQAPVYQPAVSAPPPQTIFAPVFTQPAAPVYTQPAAPVYTQPAAPMFTQPAAPVYTQPAAPMYTQPVAPVFTQPAAPVFTQPTAPVNIQNPAVVPSAIPGKLPATYPGYPQGAYPGNPALPATGYSSGAYPQYGGYAAPPAAVPPQPRFHHNMDAYTGPSMTQLKTTPGLKGEFSEFQSASEEPKKTGDIESLLVNLDDLRVEAKTAKERNNIGF